MIMSISVLCVEQAEQEVQNLLRKLKLMENDLDTAEDKFMDTNAKFKDRETQVEELTRENKQLDHRISVLEGTFDIVLIKCQFEHPP